MSEPHVQAITYFAKALGSARSGDADGAQAAIAELAELRDQLREKKDVASALSAWMITKSGPSSRLTDTGRIRSGLRAAIARRIVLLSIGLNLTEAVWTPAGLWLAVVASGLYHGVNPGMGWPLAVSAGLMDRSSRALVAALWPLTLGHLLAMFVVILPFALLVALVEWQQQIRIGASLLVIGFGIFRFVNRRHPRVLARIRPTQLGLWSFAVAIAHGAGLMLVPIYLGLCRAADLDKGHEAAGALINANLGMAVLVSVVHSLTMIAAGGCLAWLVYRYLGLRFVSRSWFNLDATWAFSLVLVGALSLAFSLASRQ